MATWHNGFQVMLTESQQLDNAQQVANRLKKKGWTKESICAICGNMHHESFLNPNMYELGWSESADRGFGLVQWTPRSKFVNWAIARGYSEKQYRSGDAQMDRIDWEASGNGGQWYGTPNYPISFSAFRKNTKNKSIDWLTQAFIWNYERPLQSAGISSTPERIRFAKLCAEKLDFDGAGSTGGTDPDEDKPSKPGGGGNPSSAIDILKKAFESFLDKIEDAMTWDMHSVGAEKFFSNSFFAMQKTFNNTYRLQMNTKLIDDMRDVINSVDTGSDGESTGNTDDKDPKPDPDKKSVAPNGKNATQIGGAWTYDNIPKKYKDAIGVPKFDRSYLNGSPFVNTGDTGQCTELTWAYMAQIWGKRQPAWDNQVTNGQRVWEVYKSQGAKTTHRPTVGYAFSSKPPYIQAQLQGIGHTGVVVAVFDDGSFLTANFNIAPNWAPSRVLLYSLINGVPKDGGNNFWFFSGIGQA